MHCLDLLFFFLVWHFHFFSLKLHTFMYNNININYTLININEVSPISIYIDLSLTIKILVKYLFFSLDVSRNDFQYISYIPLLAIKQQLYMCHYLCVSKILYYKKHPFKTCLVGAWLRKTLLKCPDVLQISIGRIRHDPSLTATIG